MCLPQDRSLLYHHVGLLYQDCPGKIENRQGHELNSRGFEHETILSRGILEINILPRLHSQSHCSTFHVFFFFFFLRLGSQHLSWYIRKPPAANPRLIHAYKYHQHLDWCPSTITQRGIPCFICQDLMQNTETQLQYGHSWNATPLCLHHQRWNLQR